MTIEKKEEEMSFCQEEISFLRKKIISLQDSVDSKVEELEVTRNQLLDRENELSMIKASKESNPFERLANW